MIAPRLARVLALVAGIAALSPAMGQGTIEVRSNATIQPGAAVRLADIATLTGDAASLADARIADGPGSLSVDDIRAALDRRREVAWDRIVLRGRACAVRAAGGAPAPRPPEAAGIEFVLAAALAGDGTLKGLVAATLARELGVEPADLRCGFDPADRERLAQLVGRDGSSVEVRSLATGDVRPVIVNTYAPGGDIASATVRVRVEVRRHAATAAREVPRGRVLTSEDVTLDERWTPPGAAIASPEAVIGASVQQRLSAGELIEESDVARAATVKKGDILLASCVQGGFAVEVRARATASARDGAELTLQTMDRKHTFRARVSGPGRAIVIADDLAEPASKERR